MIDPIVVIVGTRPGIIMMAPIIHELIRTETPHYVIHTGQHYSANMDSELFEDLSLTKPSFHLKNDKNATSHAEQTARMMIGCEAAFVERRPSLVLVNGDANTNLAAALAARKLGISLGHCEAGERSYDWRMPEEHNRRIMDHISELLFATDAKAEKTLLGEKVPGEVFVTGNTIVDASINHALIASEKSKALDIVKVKPGEYIVMTSHREENVDDPRKLEMTLRGASKAAVQSGYDVLFLIHPRTKKNMKNFGLEELAASLPRLIITDALRYLDFMQLLTNSKMVLTDSGGVQQEAFIHKKQCVTMRDNTEWGQTIECKGNRLSGTDDPDKIATCVMEALNEKNVDWSLVFGDGTASQKIVAHSLAYVNSL